MTKYSNSLCSCVYSVDASYNWIDQQVEIESVVVTHYCDKHLPDKSIRVLELLEQNRHLKERCKRLDEYDQLVDENAQLLEVLRKLFQAYESLDNDTLPEDTLPLEGIQDIMPEIEKVINQIDDPLAN